MSGWISVALFIAACITPSVIGAVILYQRNKQASLMVSTKNAKGAWVLGWALVFLVPSVYLALDASAWFGGQNYINKIYRSLLSERELRDASETYFQPSKEYTLTEQLYDYHYDVPGAEQAGKSLKSTYISSSKEYTLQQYAGSPNELDMCGEKPRVLPAGGGSISTYECSTMSSKFGDVRVDLDRRRAEVKTAGRIIYASTSHYQDDESDIESLIAFVNSLNEVPSSEVNIMRSAN